jgi:signal transduction histidine kinase
MEAPLSILLVEDNPGDTRLIKEMLGETTTTRFLFDEVSTLNTALERLREGRTGVVLLDLSLPDSSGLATFEHLRGHAPGLPVIVVTGLDDDNIALQAVQKGAQDYLVKGQVDPGLLARSIRYAIERQHNLDELEQRSRDLADRESRLATIVTTNADGLVIVDKDGIVRFVNPAAEAILGRHASDLQGTFLGYPLTSQGVAEIDLVGKAGHARTAEMRVVDVEWNGQTGYLASLRDITQHKETLKELEETRTKQLHLKDLFLSHVSHELRSPLAVIHQFVSIILDGIAGDINSEQREYLGIMERNVSHLVALIDDLLLASRCREDKVPISCRRMSIGDVMREVTETFRTSMSDKGLDLLTNTADDLPSVYADPIRVREVLTNLLDNASKFTPPGGTITMSARVYAENPDFIRVSVTDTGRGMNSDELEKVFAPLYQVGAGMDQSRTGLGLGLFICRELVTRQGGKIWAESRPGEGATLSFTLPIFLLERLLAPIMTDQNLQRGGLALISISLVPQPGRPLPQNIETLVRTARKAIQPCILVDKDVMLPQMGDDEHRGVISIVACADGEGTQILVRRIKDQLTQVDGLKRTGVEVMVSFELLDISSLRHSESKDDTLRAIARMIEEVAAENADEEGGHIWVQRKS